MPYGGTTPEQDTKIEKCVARVMPTLSDRYKDPGERKSHAIAICKSSIMKSKENVNMMLREFKLPHWSDEFKVITEGITTGKRESIRIKGNMIKATTTRNNRVYTAEELQKAKFSDNIVSLNHTDNIQDVVGNFQPSWDFDGWSYEAIIHNTPYHPGIVQMIEKGLIKHCSIEAIAGWAVKEGDNIKVGDLDFTGLGLIKTPGYPESSVAIAEAFKPLEESDKKAIEIAEEIANEIDIANGIIPLQIKLKEKKMENEQLEQGKSETAAKTPVVEKSDAKLDKLTEQVTALAGIMSKLIEAQKPKESKGIITEKKSYFGDNLVKENRKDGKIDITCKYPDRLY